jgi:8-oxo-dGTP pyrophosphatase MutT (NUDIX family)
MESESRAPVLPKDAATVALVRPVPPAADGAGYEVLLTRRPESMQFVGGAYVFPGGKVEAEDWAPGTLGRCRGRSPAAAHAAIGDPDGPAKSLGYWVAGIRELFEEAGVLLCTADGTRSPFGDPAFVERILAERDRIQRGEGGLAELLEREDLHLRADALHYLGRWITPASSRHRFDARFFVAVLPDDQFPVACARETTGTLWIRPPEAVRRWEAGALNLRTPTQTTFRYLAQFPTVEALLDHHADGRAKLESLVRRDGENLREGLEGNRGKDESESSANGANRRE